MSCRCIKRSTRYQQACNRYQLGSVACHQQQEMMDPAVTSRAVPIHIPLPSSSVRKQWWKKNAKQLGGHEWEALASADFRCILPRSFADCRNCRGKGHDFWGQCSRTACVLERLDALERTKQVPDGNACKARVG